MIKSHTLENQFLKIKTINIGASLYEVIDKRKKINLILNLGNYKNYLKNKPYLGATCGRYANRIKNAQFKIDKKTYRLSKNEGQNILHGGHKGFDAKIWDIKTQSSNSITYEYLSPHLEEGFPGNIKVLCKYQINKNSFKIIFSAKTDQKSHVNLVNHAYWNLNKSKNDIFDHFLLINAYSYLKNDSLNIPTGEYKKVDKTPYDFKQFRHVGHQIELNRRAFDENFVLNKRQKYAACLWSPHSNILLSIKTNQPGIQFYTGQHLRFKSSNKRLSPFQGLCLETQAFPNSPNNKKFPSTLIPPRKKYFHEVSFLITHQKII